MRPFWTLSALLLIFGLGWLVFARPHPVPAMAVVGDRVVYATGRTVRVFGEGGAPVTTWRVTRPVREAVSAGETVGFAYEGTDDLVLFSLEGIPRGGVPAPQKAGGQGRWAAAGSRWLFLHPERNALFLLTKDSPDWKLMLPPEEEIIKPVDVAASPTGAALLCEDPPQVLWYSFDGIPEGDLELSMRLVPSVRYYILEDTWDYLRTQRAHVPWRFALDFTGERALAIFRTPDGKYRRLAALWKEKDSWRSRGLILPTVSGRFRTGRQPQDVGFRGRGILMSGRQGGLWLYPDERYAAQKPWVDPPPPGTWEKVRHQRRWGWAALLLGLLSLWAAVATRGAGVVIPRESFLWSGASALVPGLGSFLGRSPRWGIAWFLGALFWLSVSLFLLILTRRGATVTSATLFESFAMLALVWLLSVIHAFRRGLLHAHGQRTDSGPVTPTIR
jgi:hypothetical protein